MELCSGVVGDEEWAEASAASVDGLGIVEIDEVGSMLGGGVGVGVLSNEGRLSLGLHWTLKVEI